MKLFQAACIALVLSIVTANVIRGPHLHHGRSRSARFRKRKTTPSPVKDDETFLETTYQKIFPAYVIDHDEELIKKNAVQVEEQIKTVIRALTEKLQLNKKENYIHFEDLFLGVSLPDARNRDVPTLEVKRDIKGLINLLIEVLEYQGIDFEYAEHDYGSEELANANADPVQPAAPSSIAALFEPLVQKVVLAKIPSVPKMQDLNKKIRAAIQVLERKLIIHRHENTATFGKKLAGVNVPESLRTLPIKVVKEDIKEFKKFHKELEHMIEEILHEAVKLQVIDPIGIIDCKKHPDHCF